VKLVGDFNQWDEATGIALTHTGNGYWEGTVATIGAGAQYKYVLQRKDGRWTWRIDPAARDTLDSRAGNSDNHGLVVDTAYRWTQFATPAFDDLLIYQCHIGSFCGRGDGLERANRIASVGDVEAKLDYIRELGFNAIALLPIQEFRMDRSWGYNPALYFALESAYGHPADFRRFVDRCHSVGLAVIFDVVYNHISSEDSSFWHFDEDSDNNDRDSYLSEHQTPWGLAPAVWKQEIKDFFLENMRMYIEEYRGDGLRFDATRALEANRGWGNDGWVFMQYLTWRAKELFPGKYLIAEHVPAHASIVTSAGFHATWVKEAYDRCRTALDGQDSVANLASIVGADLGPGHDYPYSWSTIKYVLGSHDECGDNKDGALGRRYLVQLFGGRDNWFARAKCRLAWALNVALQGTPLLFMGSECHMWGYWHDGQDSNGDHRFDWSIAGDGIAMEMRRLVAAANWARWNHPALRGGRLEITHRDDAGGVLAFRRWNDAGDVVLVVVNASDQNFTDRRYGVNVGHRGQWQQFLCTQDAAFGGWDNAGNAYYDPWTDQDGRIFITIPQWSVLMFRLL
jgi:1,4-alpha-glucan branching enzyme